jgi:hypothetical protein
VAELVDESAQDNLFEAAAQLEASAPFDLAYAVARTWVQLASVQLASVLDAHAAFALAPPPQPEPGLEQPLVGFADFGSSS